MDDVTKKANTGVAETLGVGASTRVSSRMKRLLVWTGVLAVLVVIGGAWWLTRSADGVRYETQVAQRGDLTVTVSATGNLQPTKEVDVGIEVSGTIRSVDVDYNDKVKVGQVLARLDTTKLEAQRLQAQAALEAARAKVQQAQAGAQEARAQLSRLKQVQALSGGKVPAQHELDTAQAGLERAQADEASAHAAVAQARATLEATQTDLSKAVIRSPINGVVLKRSVEPGQTVAASFQAPVLFTIAEDLSQMELQVDVDEADVGSVKAGQSATFTVDAYPGRTYPARIKTVYYGSETVEGVVTYKAVLTVDNADLSLRPGMTATAVITVNQVHNAVLVPNAALRFTPPARTATPEGSSRGGGLIGRLFRPPHFNVKRPENTKGPNQRVWTVRDGVLQPLDIITGATDGTMTEVKSGALEPGMPVVTGTLAPG
jgi:HlyD family secretion protein